MEEIFNGIIRDICPIVGKVAFWLAIPTLFVEGYYFRLANANVRPEMELRSHLMAPISMFLPHLYNEKGNKYRKRHLVLFFCLLLLMLVAFACNKPGESKHADIGISLPGTGETPAAPVFVDGEKVATLRGPGIADEFKKMVAEYIERRFGHGAGAATAAE